MYCIKNREMAYRLSLNPYRVYHHKQWYRLLSSSLVHIDYMHLFVNMFVLWSFGSLVEISYRHFELQGLLHSPKLAYLGLYLGGVIFSSIPDLISKKDNALYNSIGASGGVASVLFASIFIAPWNNLYLFMIIPIPKIIFAVGYIAYSTYMDKNSQGQINHKAHIWGAIFGMVYMAFLNFEFVIMFFNRLTNF